jgi:hypothetical protein
VQTIMDGVPLCWAMPNATNPALRSSENVLVVILGWRLKATVNGAQRDPGQSTAFVMFFWEHSSAIS